MKPYVLADWDMEMPEFGERVAISVDKFDVDKPEFKRSKYKVFVQGAEPPQISDPEKLYKIGDQFDLILSWNEDTLKRYPDKTMFFPFGTCWIPKEDQKIQKKSKLLSIIASGKNFLEGHKLRHAVIDKYKDKMDVFGRSYKYVESKTEVFNDYMFSIVIENVQVNNYFSEKIIDSLRAGTVPIYWGTPNISRFFNPKGFIVFESAEEMGTILDSLTKGRYDEMLPYIQENFERAAQYAESYTTRIHREVADFIAKTPKRIPAQLESSPVLLGTVVYLDTRPFQLSPHRLSIGTGPRPW